MKGRELCYAVSTRPMAALEERADTVFGELEVSVDTDEWTKASGDVCLPDGVCALYFTGVGLTGSVDITQIMFDS